MLHSFFFSLHPRQRSEEEMEEEVPDANVECSLEEKIIRLINIKASAKIK